MVEYIAWILCIGGFTVGTGIANADLNRCIHRKNTLHVFEKKHCPMTTDHLTLSCPSNKIVVLSSLTLAVKNGNSDCMKRILTQKDDFCCIRAASDVFYDGHCLQDVWNIEDRSHYQEFSSEVLTRCTNTSRCVIKSQMFANLQKEIPISKQHSSYFLVLYQCIPAPANQINLCSSSSVGGKQLDVRGSSVAREDDNKTCTCHVTTKPGNNVVVKAVDIRTKQSGLLVTSKTKSEDVSTGHLPLFGFREIFSDQSLNISVKQRSLKAGENIWLQLSGTNGNQIKVTCGVVAETEAEVAAAIPSPVPVLTDIHEQGQVFLGYWPLIYVASGSFFTLLVIVCVSGSVYLYRRRIKKSRHRQVCRHPSPPCPAEFHNGQHYATVLDDTPHVTEPATPSMCYQTLEWVYDKPYVRTYPRPDRNVQAHASNTHPPLGVPDRGAAASDVSQLEAFLNCNAHDQ